MLLSVLSFGLLSEDCRCLGALCGLMALARIDKGRLSFCFNSLGNICSKSFGDCSRTVRGMYEDCTELFGFAQGCVSLPGGCLGLVRGIKKK